MRTEALFDGSNASSGWFPTPAQAFPATTTDPKHFILTWKVPSLWVGEVIRSFPPDHENDGNFFMPAIEKGEIMDWVYNGVFLNSEEQ